MDLSKLKADLQKASAHPENTATAFDHQVTAFRVSVDKVYAASEALWSTSNVPSATGWPTKATAAQDICSLLSVTRARHTDRNQSEDEDKILQVLLHAGLAQKFIELLGVNDTTPTGAPAAAGVEDVDELQDFTITTALQYSVCKVCPDKIMTSFGS